MKLIPRRVSLVILAVLIALPLWAPLALAQTDGFGGSGQQSVDGAIEFRESATFVETFEAITAPERDHNTHSADPTDLPCAEIGVLSSDGEGNLNYGCVAYYHCGGERIDDVYTGVVSGDEAGGAYAEFLADYGGFVAFVDSDADINDTIEQLNETFLGAAFDTPSNELALPVFYYCRVGADGVLELFDPAFAPSFGWDTSVETEYDIVTLHELIRDDLFQRLDALPPQIRMTPPIEKRTAIVKFPSWFWVNEPASSIELFAESDRGTILLQGRARLRHVVWQLGTTTLECTLDDMRAFEEGLHPADDRPACSHVFDTVGDWALSATAHYDIEQQVTRRLTRSGAFVEGPWEPHPITPTYEVTTSVGVMSTREISAVNATADFEQVGDS